MELEGIVHGGAIVLDDADALAEGTRVRITVAQATQPKPFGERYARFKGAAIGLPADLADQHEHYRLGTGAGSASALIAAMEAEPHVSVEDVAELQKAIAAGKRSASPAAPF